ncbi:MAG: HEAT repeat domain-containing protein [candidate division WOR-3 bacterium]|nr:HEAT repeat domain-containing protein [Elusimicrobiota bacterium]MDH5683313.1 HEAT repeat domain-containing protein [candidate division WOR-3 bacterium]
MTKKLLRKVQVASGRTAGIIARETLAAAKKAGSMPGLIKVKTAEAIQATGKTLKTRRLMGELKKRQENKAAIFTKFGKSIFRLVVKKARNIWQREDIKGLLRELRKCEAEMGWIKAQINEIEERSKEQDCYHEAILNLSSKEQEIRLGALKSLGQLGDKEVISILVKKLKDPDLQVRRETVRILRKIIDQEYPH